MTTAQASPINWVGGKSRLRNRIIKSLPPDMECYCEVFGGAGWVLFGKERHPVEVLNDKNGELANLWRIIKWRPAELLEQVSRFPYSREIYEEIKEGWGDPDDELDRATRLYLLIHMSFGSEVSDTRSASFGYRNKSRGDLFQYKARHQLEDAFERLAGVFVEDLDFEECICRYDQPRTIFYLDPPYFDTCGYGETFNEDDFERLRQVVSDIEGKFLLTINDHEFTRELFSEFEIDYLKEPRALARGSEGRQAAPILLVSNYDPGGQRDLFSVPESTQSEG